MGTCFERFPKSSLRMPQKANNGRGRHTLHTFCGTLLAHQFNLLADKEKYLRLFRV